MTQLWPFPAPLPSTFVPVPDTDPPAFVAPWDHPIKGFLGRTLDSHLSKSWQFPKRMAANFTKHVPERKRIYAVSGSTLVGYGEDRYVQPRPNGEDLHPFAVETLNATDRGEFAEQMLRPDVYFDAGKQWGKEGATDGERFLFGFDTDDRGYVYPAYSQLGTGILRDNGQVMMAGPFGMPVPMESLWHVRPDGATGIVSALRVVCMKDPGILRYYLYVSDGQTTNVWIVTDPNQPELYVTYPKGMPGTMYDFAHAGPLTAIPWSDGTINVYSNAFGVRSINPPRGQFSSICSDGVNIYALSCKHWEGGDNAIVTIIKPTGDANVFTTETIELPGKYSGPPAIRVGAGYAAVFGQEVAPLGPDGPAAAANVRLFRVTE